MEQVPAHIRPARWWHSRRKRQFLVYAIVAVWVVWGWFERELNFWPLVWIFCAGLEWLFFRFLDPNYPNDDIVRGESYRGPPTATVPSAAWQGALAAAAVLGLIALLIWLA